VYPTHAAAEAPQTTPQSVLDQLEVAECDCALLLSCPCEESCPPAKAAFCVHCRGECDCPPLKRQPPCHRHRKAADHSLGLEEWARLQREACPREYSDQPAAMPVRTLSREARVALLEARYAADGDHDGAPEGGVSLWEENDLIFGMGQKNGRERRSA
jgi:hypothetical protein